MLALFPPSPSVVRSFQEGAESLPWTAWSADDRIALLRADRIEILDPRTSVRTTLLNFAQAGLSPAAPDAVSPSFGRLAFKRGKTLSVYDRAKGKLVSVDVGAIKGLAFSPDGTRLAYAKDRDLYVWSAATEQSLRLTTATPRTLNGVLTWLYWEEINGRREDAFAWSGDSTRLAYLQTDESPVRVSSFVGFDAVPPTVTTQVYPFAGGPNPKVRVGVVAATGGATTWVFAPGEYVTRFGWTPGDEPWALTLNRRQTQSDLWVGGRSILHDVNAQWVNLTDDVRFLADGSVLMNSQRDGFDRLYRWREGVPNPVTPPKQSLAKGLFETAGVRWIGPKGDELMFASGQPGRFERQLYRTRLDGGTAGAVTDEAGTHEASVSPNGEFFLDVHSRLDAPPQATLRRRDGRTLAVLSVRPALPPGYTKAQMLRVPARDGFRLPAYVRMPQDYDPAKRYPVVVSVYGEPGLPTVTDAWVGTTDATFTAAGYVVFAVDPRSATLLDERLPRTVKGKAMNDRELNDVVDAVRWLKAQAYVDPKRVGIWGWSGGGNMTLLALTRSQEFAAGVAVAPVTDWRYYDTFYTEGLMGLPAENGKGYYYTARWRDAAKLTGKLLMMWGTHDDNVHPINEERFLDALIAHGKGCETTIFPGRGHDLEDPAATAAVYRTMLEFFGRNL